MSVRLTFSAVAASVLVAIATAHAQQAPTFSSSTRLVTVAVSVMKGGQPVTGLTKADFEVRSDNELMPIVQFTNEPGPITAAVLLDASGSMDVNGAMVPAGIAARELLADLAPGVDRAGVFTFDDALQTVHDFAPVGPSQILALDGIRAFGSTSLYDAVLNTGRALAASSSPRRAVVVLTDGVDTTSTYAPLDVSAYVAAIDVPVYIFVFGASSTPTLEALAHGTGGQVFTMRSGVSVQAARATIVSNLRQHYLLAFEPDVQPGWHSLSVRTRQNHTVRARAGYSVTPRLTS
jgi:VWFA-related protein